MMSEREAPSLAARASQLAPIVKPERDAIDGGHCSEQDPAHAECRPAQPALEPTETIGTRRPRGPGARFVIAASYRTTGYFGRPVASVQFAAFGLGKFGFVPASLAAAWDRRRGLVFYAEKHAPPSALPYRSVRCRLRRLNGEGGRRYTWPIAKGL